MTTTDHDFSKLTAESASVFAVAELSADLARWSTTTADSHGRVEVRHLLRILDELRGTASPYLYSDPDDVDPDDLLQTCRMDGDPAASGLQGACGVRARISSAGTSMRSQEYLPTETSPIPLGQQHQPATGTDVNLGPDERRSHAKKRPR